MPRSPNAAPQRRDAFLALGFRNENPDAPLPPEWRALDITWTSFSVDYEEKDLRHGAEVFIYRPRRGVTAYGVTGELLPDLTVFQELDDEGSPIPAAQLRDLKLQLPTADNPIVRLSAFERLSLKTLWEVAEERSDAERRYRDAKVAVRDGQPEFAAAVRRRFNHRCPLSGWGRDFCQAAHIVPYPECEGEFAAGQADPDNGIWLATHLHQAFDRDLFAIRLDGTIVWSKQLSKSDRTLAQMLASRIPVRESAAPYLAWRLAQFEAAEAEFGVAPAAQLAPACQAA